MIIIGIDPGTRVTGYGIIETDGIACRAVDYGCIRPPVSLKLSDKYLVLFNAIEELIDKYRPVALAVETQYVKKNVMSAIKLGMARCAAILAAKRKGLAIFEYAPSKAKVAVVGKGGASKYQVQGMVRMLLRLPNSPLPEDAADALALALCHAHTRSKPHLCGEEI